MTNTSTKLTDLLPSASDGSVALPAAGTSVAVTLEPGAYSQFLFKMDQIQDVSLRADGALEMKMVNGGTLVIQNFQALANSAESCGRDTIFQLLKDVPGAADGATGLQIVNIAPDALLRAIDPMLANDKTVTIQEPGPAMTREVVMEPGQTYKFNFDWNGAAKTVDGTNLMLSFKNGGLVILRDFVPVTAGDLPPEMTLSDGTVLDASHLIAASCTPTGATPLAMAAPDIEPAAGDAAPKIAMKKAPMADVAQMVADIEPAAGGDNPSGIGGRGGAGFSSGIDPANLNGLNPLGPIGPTSLSYGIPSVNDFPVGAAPALVEPPVTPPEPPKDVPDAPTLQVEDVCVLEDGSVLVPISAQLTDRDGSEYLTITVEGIPAGWGVNPNGGTYDAATHRWTIQLPAGQNFSGGPILSPPTDSDVDTPALRVTATSTERDGSTAQETKDAHVHTDAVADTPEMGVTSPVHGEQDTSIALDAGAALNDTDGSEVLTIRVTGLPAGATLSAGTLQNDGSYILTAAQLDGLKVTPAAGYTGSFTLTFTAIATETNLSGEECDLTNNVATKSCLVTIRVDADDQPVIVNAQNIVDETNLTPVLVSGSVNPDYGSDTGSVSATSASSFISSGSKLNGDLTSNGVPVVVTLQGNTYIGKAGATTVFTLQVNADGTYQFQLSDNLDHANAQDPNDVINLVFGVKATDSDNDVANGTITIGVRDDAPIAQDDQGVIVNNVATGNVTSNDDPGEDGPGSVTAVIFNGVTTVIPTTGTVSVVGQYGTLQIAANGAYTYTARNGANGTDAFTYVLTDRDGDQDPAILRISTSDGQPVIGDATQTVDETNLGPIVVNGTLTSNYGSDGPGAIMAQGATSFGSTGSKLGNILSSGGVPVVVTLEGNTYIGKAGATTVFTLQVNADGSYQFRLLDNLDHANAQDPNDVINLNFGVKITDQDGDSDLGTITIQVRDDAPVPHADQNIANTCDMVTGNVLTNDVSTESPYVSSVTFNGHSYTVAPTGQTTVVGTYGTLTIERDGDYTYTPKCQLVITNLDPICDDVIYSDTTPMITKNGVTIQGIDRVTGATATDLSWVFDDNNIGNTGIGINSGAMGGNEAFRITYGAEPADAVWVTLGNLNATEQGLVMARVYLAGATSPVTIALTHAVAGPYPGIVSYKIDAEALFHDVPITKVDIYLNDPSNRYSATLINVSVERYSEGTDHFGYTVTDADGDSATSTLAIDTDNDHLGAALSSAIAFDDDLTLAINDFVAATGVPESVGGTVHVAAFDVLPPTADIISAPDLMDQMQQAA